MCHSVHIATMQIYSVKNYFVDATSSQEVLFIKQFLLVPCSLLILNLVEKASTSYEFLASENIGRKTGWLMATLNQCKNPWPALP